MPEPDPDTTSQTTETPETSETTIAPVAMIGIYAAIGFFFAWNNDTSRAFITRNSRVLIPVAIAAALLLITAFALKPSREWLQMRTAPFKSAMIAIAVPLLLIFVVGGAGYLPPRFQITALRAVFLFTVCLLPGTLWYLFIATRKWTVLNDYLVNLDRLGLLKPRVIAAHKVEDPNATKRRFYDFLEKFEAVYGRLPAQTRDQILRDGYLDPASPVSEGAARVVLSTTAVPLVISTTLIVLGWIITLPPVPDNAAELLGLLPGDSLLSERWVTALAPAESAVTFAFLGAYFFSIQLLFRRYVRNDLAGSAYVKVAMRIVLAVVATWAASAALLQVRPAVSDTALIVLGFTVGIFPAVGVDLVKKVFGSITGLAPKSDNQLPLRELDGMSIFHETRLDEEDIENVPNMATADVVELMLKTRFSAERIVDWVDQAILLTHLGRDKPGREARRVLSKHGIRSASGAFAADARGRGDSTLMHILDPATRMPALLDALRTSPNIHLVMMWKVQVDAGAIIDLTSGQRAKVDV